ncbi:MAG: hypothetical protein HFG90_04765 [Acholeplasmatales bacterium]|nr:hypothetical protein [Acholeplasmatales bacterium]
MKKGFIFQRIGFFLYLFMLLVAAAYALSFMTDYGNLFGFVYLENKPVTDFYNKMQTFNQISFWFAVVGAISIIAMFALQLKTKVSDLFALGIMSSFGAVNVASGIYGLMTLPKLMSEYKLVDFSNLHLEDPIYKDTAYEMQFRFFYIGFAVFSILLVITLIYVAILWINHFIYKKSEVVAHE